MNSSGILSIITFVYGLAGFCYIFAWIFKKHSVGKAATWVALIGLAGNIAGVVLRWVESYQMGFGHAPLSNLYESLVFFAGTIVLIYLLIERKYNNRVIGAFVAPIAFLAMAYASLSPNISDRIQPLIPALKSNWLIAHVIACFIGYGAFAVAFGVSLMYLMKQKSADDTGSIMSHLPDAGVLDELNHQLVMLGFLFLSVGIITGAVWANSAWGRYWGWDPKETWSLITWFVYATLLHARLMRGWRGKRTAVLSISGFGAVMFTYFGVNLLPGLHSYGSF
ncbi:MAG: c-type cytochrome biogenesis protein CcsB [Desulfobacteraceae bacterium]|jgi:cytochrome c-type biogenesis protein CcsB|nr:c-type cytochrome biogenesis protein CcsB [Desulfobacteraceae bacterium]